MPEYWLIDPEAHTLERLVLQGDSYVIATSLEGDDVFLTDSSASNGDHRSDRIHRRAVMTFVEALGAAR